MEFNRSKVSLFAGVNEVLYLPMQIVCDLKAERRDSVVMRIQVTLYKR